MRLKGSFEARPKASQSPENFIIFSGVAGFCSGVTQTINDSIAKILTQIAMHVAIKRISLPKNCNYSLIVQTPISHRSKIQ
tara:strand:+ start:474 stop:716 length:243 start_codon:yes stop_codon:yes gene_type:complete